MPMMSELLRLEVPAQPAYVGVARSVVVAVASSVSGIGEDRMEDLRIAVSEACTNAVEARGSSPDDRVVLRCGLSPERFEISIDGAATADATPGSDAGWGVQLIRALVDDVTFDRSGNGSSVHLSMRRADPTAL